MVWILDLTHQQDLGCDGRVVWEEKADATPACHNTRYCGSTRHGGLGPKKHEDDQYWGASFPRLRGK